jgi:hypothetical protein
MHSWQWKNLRKKVFKRANGLCERCHNAPPSIIHHLNYLRIYHEDMSDLQAVCEPCQAFVHGWKPTDPLTTGPAWCLFTKEELIMQAARWHDAIFELSEMAVAEERSEWQNVEAILTNAQVPFRRVMP